MTDTQEIKNRLDLVDVVQGYGVQLRKAGRSFAGFCPFHPNTKTPAFFVFPDTQTWHCFGACAEGGDVFSFVMKKNGWDFKEALEELAGRAGVTLEPQHPKDVAREAVDERLVGLLDVASNYYHQLLLHAPQAETARKYVTGRVLHDDTLAEFRIGYALDSWDAARTHFTAQGYSEGELLAAGLLTEHGERHTRYDRFRNRLMIPICDLDGRVVGFGARALDPDDQPKYLNSPQTALFDKGRLIFGLDMARRHIREAREVVLVEGYLDVITAWQNGFRNVVAQMGTSLTEAQLRLLQKQTRRFILALDSDAAGAKATLRSLQLARETLDRDLDVGFNARGLVQIEGRLKADIRIVTMPDGKDPDDIIREDPAAWPKLLKEARPVVDYVIRVVAADLEPGDAKGKAAAAKQVLPLINDIAEPVERDHYLGKLARTLGIDVSALRQAMTRQRQEAKRRPPERRPVASGNETDAGRTQLFFPPEPDAPPDDDGALSRGTPASGGKLSARRLRHTARLEEDFLRQCLENPGALARVNSILTRHDQPEVSDSDFVRADDKAIFAEIRRRATQPSVAAIDEMCDSLDPVLAQRVRSLVGLPPRPGMKLDRLPDALVISVLDWRLEKIREHNSILKQIYPAGPSEPDDELTRSYLERIQEMGRINQARSDMSAASRRREEDELQARRSR